jgi:hypothetical protein
MTSRHSLAAADGARPRREGLFLLLIAASLSVGLAMLVGGAVAQGFARVGAQLTLAQAPAIGGAR